MLTINLKGGMGNQMFQYATGRSLSIQYKTTLKFNTEYFDNIPKEDTPRTYQLDTFHISNDVNFSNTISPVRKLWQKISRRIWREELRISVAKLLLKLNLSVHLDGYFQNPSYFNNIRPTLLAEFAFAKEMNSKTWEVKEMLTKTNSVAINVRRADYLRPDYVQTFGVLNMDYYTKAMDLIREKTLNPLFCVFSDDPNWVKENFTFERSIFVNTDEFKDYEQLYLMTQCRHNILANSSFAWWGAWLGTNEEKIVVAPKQWSARQTAKELGILPENWITL